MPLLEARKMKRKWAPSIRGTKPPLLKESVKQEDGTTIRKGNRRPYKRAPYSEINLRIAAIALLVRKGLTNFQIHDLACPKYDISWQQCDVYIRKSKEYLKERAGISVEQAKNKGLDMLLDRMEKGNDGIKLAAERRVSEIMGYNAPTKIAPTTPDGTEPYQPLVIAVNPEELPKPKKK